MHIYIYMYIYIYIYPYICIRLGIDLDVYKTRFFPHGPDGVFRRVFPRRYRALSGPGMYREI